MIQSTDDGLPTDGGVRGLGVTGVHCIYLHHRHLLRSRLGSSLKADRAHSNAWHSNLCARAHACCKCTITPCCNMHVGQQLSTKALLLEPDAACPAAQSQQVIALMLRHNVTNNSQLTLPTVTMWHTVPSIGIQWVHGSSMLRD
jgi:hypothetical protein